MRAGAEGAGAALAMRLVVRAAEGLEAPRLEAFTGAHVDSCLVRFPVVVLSSSDLASIRDCQQQRVEEDGRVTCPAAPVAGPSV